MARTTRGTARKSPRSRRTGGPKKRIALLIEDIFEDMEAMYPYYRFKEAGYTVDVIGPKAKQVYKGKYGVPLESTLAADKAKASDYAGVMIPGGYSPDKMRRNEKMVKLVRDLDQAGKLVAAICHAGWMLAEADIVRGRQFTSVSAIKTDLINAGGTYQNKEVVIDGNLITSRTPPDLPALMKACLEFLETNR